MSESDSRTLGDVSRAFDARAASYCESDWHLTSAHRLVDLCRLKPGDVVLDAGTGTGFAALAAAARVAPHGRVVGVDISPGMLKAARDGAAAASVANLELILGDATNLPQLATGFFDAVTSATSLLYMDVPAALQEWHRLLAPGGLLGFSTMCAGFPVGGRLFRECAARAGIDLSDPCEPLGLPAAARAAVEAAGFRVLEIVEEPVAFTSHDLDRAWESNLLSPRHQKVRDLDARELENLREQYLRALAAADPEVLASSEMLYVLGAWDSGLRISD